MFETFSLLTNLLSLTISDAMVTCCLFSFYLHVKSPLLQNFAVRICRRNFPWLFSARIWRRNLPWEFDAEICHDYLPWEFAAGNCRGYLPWFFCICKQILFCVCKQILFIWKQNFFICEQSVFICEIFIISSVSFCFYRGSYGPP